MRNRTSRTILVYKQSKGTSRYWKTQLGMKTICKGCQVRCKQDRRFHALLREARDQWSSNHDSRTFLNSKSWSLKSVGKSLKIPSRLMSSKMLLERKVTRFQGPRQMSNLCSIKHSSQKNLSTETRLRSDNKCRGRTSNTKRIRMLLDSRRRDRLSIRNKTLSKSEADE
jgi:hypothetical protein